MASGTFTSRPPLRSKFAQSYDALLAGKQPWTVSSATSSSRPVPTRTSSTSSGKAPAEPRARFFADLLCLDVDARHLSVLIDPLTTEDLLDDEPDSKGAAIRENIGALWREALRVLKEENEDALRRGNAVETLIALSYPILIKRFPNYAFDLISIFAGSMDDADDVFLSFVAALDITLRAKAGTGSSENPPELQHRVLQLALLWLSAVAQTSLAAYFQRADLFGAASMLISSPSTASFAYEASLLLALLAGSGADASGAGSGVYARRLREWTDLECMNRIAHVGAAALERARGEYTALADDSAPTIVGGLAGFASLKWVAGLGELVGLPGATQEPKPPPPRARTGKDPLAGGEFAHLPPAAAVVLLPLFQLVRSNQTFVGLMFNPSPVTPGLEANNEKNPSSEDKGANPEASASSSPSLPIALLSLSTYLSSHASSSHRSRAYTRITLTNLCALLSSPAGTRALLDDSPASTAAAAQVRVCRQKLPPLPSPVKERKRLLPAVLDTATLFLRHNLSKRLDVGSYLLSLRLIQRSIVICGTERLQLEYEWEETWRALLGLATFLAGRHGEMRVSSDVGQVVLDLIATLGLALWHSDRYLGTPSETHALLYELLRSSSSLRSLLTLLPSSSSFGISSASGTSTPLSAYAPSTPLFAPSAPGWKTVDRVLSACEARIEEWGKGGAGKTPTPGVKTVKKLIAEVDLEPLLAGAEEEMRGLGGAEDWQDRAEDRTFMQDFLRYACADVLGLLPIY